MDDSERRNQLAGIRDAIQKGAFQPIGMNEAKRMLEKHLSDENAKDDTVTISRIGYEGLCASYDRLHARVAELEARIVELEARIDRYKAWHDGVKAIEHWCEGQYELEVMYRPQFLKENE